MPRTYKCRKCGVVHPPPTGKHCREQFNTDDDSAGEQPVNFMLILRELQKQMKEVMETVGNNARGEATPPPDSSPQPSTSGVEADVFEDDITPTSLRRRTPVMKKATNRLAKIRWQDDEVELLAEMVRNRTGGKKSGSIMVAAETVEERIDWPHMYVTRASTGRRKGVAYNELTSEEFAYGYMCMIESSKCKWDLRTMVQLYRMVMNHAINYSWENARAWYEEMGVEVKNDMMEWTDIDRVREIQFMHTRVRTTERKEVIERGEPARQPLKIAPQGTKACAAYQTKACEQARDHAPYTHTCTYCLKSCNALCRHPEADCIRRVIDAAKNDRRREQ